MISKKNKYYNLLVYQKIIIKLIKYGFKIIWNQFLNSYDYSFYFFSFFSFGVFYLFDFLGASYYYIG